MLALLAWRNIWRNHRRSLIILVSIMTGVSSMIFTEGLSRGFLRQVSENELASHIAHIQIHTRGFRDNPTAQGFMRDTLRVPAAVRQYAGVPAFSMRAISFGLVSSASGSSYKYLQEGSVREGTYQETPERIAYRFKEYLPEIGATLNTIRNETRGEEYDRQGYIYTPPMVQLALSNKLELEQRIPLDVNQYLDIFVKKDERVVIDN